MNILTCGVFDLLHIGHINFLHKIKNKDDKLFVLIHSDRFVSTYKRIPIINENNRLLMIQNIKSVNGAFIDDNEYLTMNIIKKFNINIVYQAVTSSTIWNYYYHIPIRMNIMKFIEYNNNCVSTTEIINLIKKKYIINDYNNRYTRENILKSEKIYGIGYQSPGLGTILDDIIPEKMYDSILEIGCGLGGNCSYLYKRFNSNITGLDICKHMIDICNERNNTDIKYVLKDYGNFNTNKIYDLILCRDVFMYIHTEKKYLFLNKINKELSKDGAFILIDYCKGPISSTEFIDYCINRNWNIINVPFYKKLIKYSGFKIIEDGILTQTYINYFKSIDIDIDIHVKENLDKKINYLNKEFFEWHYFILKKI